MSELPATSRPEQSDPVSVIFRLVWGYTTSAITHTAFELGLPDLLETGPRSADDLAEEAGAHGPSLHRLLRAMAALGITRETGNADFALTEAGALLGSKGAGSMDALARLLVHESMWRPWQGLTESVRTGEPVFESQFGMDYWAYMKQHPDVSDLFNAAMGDASQAVGTAVAAAYDLTRFRTVVDVGGGNGTLLAALLQATPGLRGIVFDSPPGVAQAEDHLVAAGVGDRCEAKAGDFLEALPEGGDLYVFKSVIHDWDDERATTILRNCRRVLPADGRLLIVEPVVPEAVTVSPADPFPYLNDLNMMVSLRGKERTRSEYEALLTAAGFRLCDIQPVPGPERVFLIEATPNP
ncbi:methyltransferase [Streptomyces collinus]|uniref:methyltransferase n=1 Tax=Streptomyces collinus TaxID=42684 RepID=UPI002943A4DD|nr:methyltransferase [Streptomyces collinus]